MSVPGIRWVLAFTIAAEIGDIDRFASPEKLTGYTGLCPASTSRRQGSPRPADQARPHLPALGAARGHDARARHPAYPALPAQARLGKQRGAKVAQVDIARRLAHAIWHMLTRNQLFPPPGAPLPLAASPPLNPPPQRNPPPTPRPPPQEAQKKKSPPPPQKTNKDPDKHHHP